MGHYQQIIVDGTPTGMQAPDEIFAQFYAEQWQPTADTLGPALVEAAKKDNYIPRSARNLFAETLVHEYQFYVAQRERGETVERPNYDTWRGYPRESIPWYPSINADLCDGCGACLKLCSHQALAPTVTGKVRVADMFRCVVGCSSCAHSCKPGAITFPSRSMLAAYRHH